MLCVFSGSRAGDGPCVHPSSGSGSHHWKEGTAHQTAEPLRWCLHQGQYCTGFVCIREQHMREISTERRQISQLSVNENRHTFRSPKVILNAHSVKFSEQKHVLFLPRRPHSDTFAGSVQKSSSENTT